MVDLFSEPLQSSIRGSPLGFKSQCTVALSIAAACQRANQRVRCSYGSWFRAEMTLRQIAGTVRLRDQP